MRPGTRSGLPRLGSAPGPRPAAARFHTGVFEIFGARRRPASGTSRRRAAASGTSSARTASDAPLPLQGLRERVFACGSVAEWTDRNRMQAGRRSAARRAMVRIERVGRPPTSSARSRSGAPRSRPPTRSTAEGGEDPPPRPGDRRAARLERAGHDRVDGAPRARARSSRQRSAFAWPTRRAARSRRPAPSRAAAAPSSASSCAEMATGPEPLPVAGRPGAWRHTASSVFGTFFAFLSACRPRPRWRPWSRRPRPEAGLRPCPRSSSPGMRHGPDPTSAFRGRSQASWSSLAETRPRRAVGSSARRPSASRFRAFRASAAARGGAAVRPVGAVRGGMIHRVRCLDCGP